MALLKITGNGWKWLDMAEMAGHCLDRLKRAGNGFKWLKMAENRWTGYWTGSSLEIELAIGLAPARKLLELAGIG